jgi:O-antigen/teichoic acid export membrane protein
MTRTSNNAGTIARNTLWYAVDASTATIVMLIASVPVARVMGPAIMGHYVYLVFITNMAQRLANVGIPATACKYMSEFLGRGDRGTARAVFRDTLRHQARVATVVTLVGLLVAWRFAEPGFRLVSALMVLSIWPGMVNNIPAQANVAAESLRANIPASFVSFISYTALIVLTLLLGWGLVGLACATLISRTLEAATRYAGVRRRIRRDPVATLPADLRRRMFVFSTQNMALLFLGLVVWDRSELFFLKRFCDVSEIAFYSVAFSITNQLLMAPRAFSSAVGVTVFAQYGRDRERLVSLIQNATRYVWVVAIPMFLGVAAISAPLIHVVYGSRYFPVVPVLALMSILCIPRAFQVHTENLLQATETQGFMVRWLAISAAVNLLLDVMLIPVYGALGAALANGLAQTLAVGGLWLRAKTVVPVTLPWRFFSRIAVSGIAMAIVVVLVERSLPDVPALIVGVVTGIGTFLAGVRLTRSLEFEDWMRLTESSDRLPDGLQRVFLTTLNLVLPSRAVEIWKRATTVPGAAGV